MEVWLCKMTEVQSVKKKKGTLTKEKIIKTARNLFIKKATMQPLQLSLLKKQEYLKPLYINILKAK